MELELIKNSILEIRGKKVMLDMDLAKIYEVETRALKQAVRRNLDRFPQDFMFQLTKEEWSILRSQIVTLEVGKGNHPKFLPFAFTEQGVAMLSAVLKSQRAINASIAIMRAFVMIRQWALTYQELSDKLLDLEKLHNQKFNDIDQVLKDLLQKEQT
ncbi:MAG: ORF6N domain-containing protein, partial [Flavobacteriales bacterium]